MLSSILIESPKSKFSEKIGGKSRQNQYNKYMKNYAWTVNGDKHFFIFRGRNSIRIQNNTF